MYIAEPLLLEPLGKDGGEPTEAEKTAAEQHHTQQSHPATFIPAVASPVAPQSLPQHTSVQLPAGVLDDGVRAADAVSLYTLGRITLDHELLASKMVQIESGVDHLPEQLQNRLYVEPISFTQTLFNEAMYPRPPGPTPPTAWRVKKVCCGLTRCLTFYACNCVMVQAVAFS